MLPDTESAPLVLYGLHSDDEMQSITAQLEIRPREIKNRPTRCRLLRGRRCSTQKLYAIFRVPREIITEITYSKFIRNEPGHLIYAVASGNLLWHWLLHF